MRTARLTALLAVALVVTSCGGDAPPQVTFTAGTAAVVAGPTQYCDLQMTACHNDDKAPAELPVPPGTPLQVTVPDEIAKTPWQLVFSYRDATGAQADERSRVFTPGERSVYTLELPTPGDRLLVAQVQQFGAAPQANPDTGEIDYPIRASWVLTASA